MQRCRGPVQSDAPGPSRAPRWRWPAVAGATALLVAAVGCTSSATTTSPATVSPATVSQSAASSAAADWPTYDRTAERSGVAVSSPALVAVRQSWSASVDGAVYAQPLVVGSEVIVATENDSVYALGASSGAVLWTRRLASPVTAGLPCGNINPSGITGTPVADPATGRLWVVTFTAQPTYQHTLWELDLATGQTDWQRPIDVSGSDPRAQQERGALTLLGSRVYVPFGGLDGDCSDYKGRIAGAPVSGYAAGPPIIAGGVVWDVSRAGLLSGFRLSDGKSVFSTTTAAVVTDFPSLSASGLRLIVPEGDKIVSYLGI